MDLKQLLNQTTIDTSKEDVDVDIDDEQGQGKEPEKDPEQGPEQSVEVDSQLNDVVDEQEGEPGNENLHDDDIDPRFKYPWNKLEKGKKLNRILLFITQETEDKNLSDNLSKDLKNILFNACDRGLFNKITDVEYDEETCIINSVKCLEFNESTKKYKLKSKGVKNRSVSKSRSNIDRLMKKK